MQKRRYLGQCEFVLMTSSCSSLPSCERRAAATLEEINNGPIIFVLGKKREKFGNLAKVKTDHTPPIDRANEREISLRPTVFTRRS